MEFLSTDRLVGKLERVESFFSQDVARFQQRLIELDSEISPDATPVVKDEFHLRLLDAFQESQSACRLFEGENGDDPKLIRDVQAGFRQETEPWFGRSWIAHRARSKPSGFPGDFEMLIKLYEKATPARGLGGYLDRCILELPLARAVRARMTAAREFLIAETANRKDNVRILDLASGPCREYIGWPEPAANTTLEVVAMDNDPLALAWVDEHITPQMPSRTNLITTRYNALRTRSAEATKKRFGQFDIIYSVGLFDYLTDELLIPILASLYETLRPEGVMYIAFKDTRQYDKTPYQWHLDWFFHQRTQQDCEQLFAQAGLNVDGMAVTRDDTGIILNFISRRTTNIGGRTDLPESIHHRIHRHLPIITPAPRE